MTKFNDMAFALRDHQDRGTHMQMANYKAGWQGRGSEERTQRKEWGFPTWGIGGRRPGKLGVDTGKASAAARRSWASHRGDGVPKPCGGRARAWAPGRPAAWSHRTSWGLGLQLTSSGNSVQPIHEPQIPMAHQGREV